MDLTEYAASKLFVKAVDFLSRFQKVKLLGVNEAYHIQLNKMKDFKKKNGGSYVNGTWKN